MISFISGTVEAVTGSAVVINTGGVGYRVILPERVHGILAKVGQKVKLFVYPNFNVREGSFELFGFEKAEELEFFEMLLTVSGIGPRSAQGLMTKADVPTLQLAIIKGESDYLRQITGLGPKTAQRLILELKTKLASASFGPLGDRDLAAEGEALEALTALGYSVYRACAVLAEIKTGTAEEKIKEALKRLGNKK